MRWCSEKGIPHSEFLKWEDSDRSKLIAFWIEDALRCSLCGTAQWEWDEDRFAYEATHSYCHGCYIKRMADDESGGSLPGTTVTLIASGSVEHQRIVAARERESEARRQKVQEAQGGSVAR